MGKLYREDPDDNGFRNTPQDGLSTNAEKLDRVIMRDRFSREGKFWPTWAAFAAEVGLVAL